MQPALSEPRTSAAGVASAGVRSPRPSPPPEGIGFRPRGDGDLDGLFDLFNERTFLDNASTHGRFESRDAFEDWLASVAPCARFEVVAHCGDEIVGFGGLYTLAGLMNHSGSIMLGVRETWQNRKIGKTILHILLRTGEIMTGLRKIQLTVLTHNVPAVELYRQFGFETEGLHRRFMRRGDDFVDAYSMAKFFDRPSATPG